MAMAAGLALVAMNIPINIPTPPGTQTARINYPRNHAWIDRVAGRGVVGLRQQPKDGTTVILVDYAQNGY
jgi:hypothetical protein